MEIILYPVVIITGFFIRILPVRLSLWLARGVGSLAYIFYGKRRSIGYANIKAAFSYKLSPGEIKNITKLTFQHFAQVLFEVFRFPDIDEKYVDRYVRCDGFDNIDAAIRKGKGAIILTAHFGNWELSGLAGAIKGYPQDVLARQQKFLRLNKLLNRYRERFGRRVIEKGMATRGIISALKANKVVAILSDQDGGAGGVLVNFFGRLASTPQGAAAFALKFDSVVLPNFCARKEGPFYHLVVERPIDTQKSGDSYNDIQDSLQKFTDVLQKYIAEYPGQWLWLHKRWKTTPSRSVLILSDGKAGHLNQAKAAASQIKMAVFQKAESDERVKLLRMVRQVDDLIYKEKVVEIKYKSKFHKAVLTFCNLFASSRCQGCMKCVRFCLAVDSYKSVISNYADIVISCGSSTSALNKFLCIENRAKSVVIMKPGILPVKNFDLCLIPRHDNPKNLKNVVVTEGALNMAGKSAVETRLIASLQIGLLIGGDNKDFVLTESNMADVLDGVVSFSERTNASISATTSRRTPKNIEALIKNRLAKLNNCKSLVIANENNRPGVVNEILNSSAITVVSGESISMVSEAASSGSKTIVFKLKTRKRKSPAWPGQARHAKFLENLSSKGYIVLCEPGDIKSAIEQTLNDTRPVKRLNDGALVYEAVKKLI